MKKKRKDQNGDRGSIVMAWGYTTKASPGPRGGKGQRGEKGLSGTSPKPRHRRALGACGKAAREGNAGREGISHPRSLLWQLEMEMEMEMEELPLPSPGCPRQRMREEDSSSASPALATWLTGTPSSWDMYPRTEKMANPARMLVTALPRVTMKVSLGRTKQMLSTCLSLYLTGLVLPRGSRTCV